MYAVATGLKKTAENQWNQGGPNSKNTDFIVLCFKISEKDKSQQKYVKKLDQILRLLVKKFL
jgi:hypothetical protein